MIGNLNAVKFYTQFPLNFHFWKLIFDKDALDLVWLLRNTLDGRSLCIFNETILLLLFPRCTFQDFHCCVLYDDLFLLSLLLFYFCRRVPSLKIFFYIGVNTAVWVTQFLPEAEWTVCRH